MVCIYCGGSTQVVNSRLQRRINQVWRRRTCQICENTFTTSEQANLEASLVIQYSNKDIRAFSRDNLFISLYESCKHRTEAMRDADGLCQTIIALLRQDIRQASLSRSDVIMRSLEVLERFDKTAAAVYAAYHPLKR